MGQLGPVPAILLAQVQVDHADGPALGRGVDFGMHVPLMLLGWLSLSIGLGSMWDNSQSLLSMWGGEWNKPVCAQQRYQSPIPSATVSLLIHFKLNPVILLLGREL